MLKIFSHERDVTRDLEQPRIDSEGSIHPLQRTNLIKKNY